MVNDDGFPPVRRKAERLGYDFESVENMGRVPHKDASFPDGLFGKDTTPVLRWSVWIQIGGYSQRARKLPLEIRIPGLQKASIEQKDGQC